MRKLAFLFLASLPIFAQVSPPGIPWRASVTTSLSASASYSFTVQQGGANIQNLQSAAISCGTNTFTVAQAQNGTAATATALTQTTSGTVATSANALVVLSPQALATPLTVTAWIASNVGTGVATSGPQPFSSLASIGLGGRQLLANSTAQNYTFIVTNTGSGSCTLLIDVWGTQLQ
jgi:hypothetical protein